MKLLCQPASHIQKPARSIAFSTRRQQTCICSHCCKTAPCLLTAPLQHEAQTVQPAPRTSTDSSSTIEGSTHVLPVPIYRLGRLSELYYQYIETYHLLGALVVAANIGLIIALSTQTSVRLIPLARVSTALAANITLTIIIRNEVIINLLFILSGSLPRCVPLTIRRLVAKVYHFGGIHSGAASSAFLWLIMFNIVLFGSSQSEYSTTTFLAMGVTTIVIDVLIFLIITTSLSCIREQHHNFWEYTHRFGGWLVLALFWAQFGLSVHTRIQRQAQHRSLSWIFIQEPTFWLLITTTIGIIWPWLSLRKVDMVMRSLSDHTVRLDFTYTNMSGCAASRFSDSPLWEWHSFAGIPRLDGKGFWVMVSRAGDWTSRLIEQPRSKLWVRGIPIRGVLHIAQIFKRVVLVATGSGIGPVLSLLRARRVQCRIIWSTRQPKKRYGADIIASIKNCDSSAIIFDTSLTGRPDLILEAYKLSKEMDAEAVFVISNKEATKRLVFALECRGIATFAPIFDS